MGNDQSRGTEPQDKALDYYDLLEVNDEATGEEIKRSYRRLALINHPDKNPHRIEEATKLFADLQQAYEVLSDPNERAFYDSHRNITVITDEDLYDHVRSGATPKGDPSKRRYGDPGVRLEQLLRFFDPKLARRLDDSKEGFFSIYRSLFSLLASDENLHSPDPIDYPSFGDSQTTYSPPHHLTRAQRQEQTWARDFYTVWSEFSTAKKFEWVEKWDSDKGNDRGIRRLMEKENKRTRDEYKKEYNDTIRKLALFIQHRDPRYKAYRAVQAERKQKKAKAAAKVVAPQPPAPIQGVQTDSPEFEEQDWQRLRHSSDEDDEEVDEDQIYECIACNKTFLSEASWTNHERSKKHKLAMHKLKVEMQLDDETMDSSRQRTDTETEELEEALVAVTLDEAVQGGEAIPNDSVSLSRHPSDKIWEGEKEVKQPKVSKESETDSLNREESALDKDSRSEVDTSSGPSKRDKRRAKEAKKKAEEEERKVALKQARKGKQPALVPEPKAEAAKQKKPVKTKKVAEVFTEEKIQAAVDSVKERGHKLRERWTDHWPDILRNFQCSTILCLGLGRPYSDRTAQIQLALMLELSLMLSAPMLAFDPVWDDGDRAVLKAVNVVEFVDNLRGAHTLGNDQNILIYMPHCSRPLYESLLSANYNSTLSRHLMLGNDLADYLPEMSRSSSNPPAGEEAFSKPKKKRKDRCGPRDYPDTVLRRLVPQMEAFSLSEMPETNLPGFARAFLSLSLQWLPSSRIGEFDWEKPLPPVEWPEDGEVV